MQMGKFCPFWKWIHQIKNELTRLPQQCWRWCGQINGHHSLILWLCPKNKTFWGQLFCFFQDFGIQILRDVKLLYFCVLRTGLNLNLLVLCEVLLQFKVLILLWAQTHLLFWLKIKKSTMNAASLSVSHLMILLSFNSAKQQIAQLHVWKPACWSITSRDEVLTVER